MPLETLIAFIVVLGVLVFFHEWGHFISAKLTGIRVEEFAFGFGPRLVRLFKRGDTEYTIHAAPLGGFVKLAGMEPGEEDIPDGFQAQAIWKRAIVIFSGPLFSFILAVLGFQFIGLFWGFQDENRTLNKVLMVDPNTVASGMNLRAGDQILEINGIRIKDGTQMIDIIHGNPGKPVTLLVKRNGHVDTRTAVASWRIRWAGAGWSFMTSNRANVVGVAKGSEAAKAGIQADDQLISINGKPIRGGKAMRDAIQANGASKADVELKRGKQTIRASLEPTIQSIEFAGVSWYFPGAYAAEIDKKLDHGKIRFNDQLVSIDDKKIKTADDMLAAIDRKQNLTIELKRPQAQKPVRVDVAAGHVESSRYEAIGLLGFTPQFAFTKTNLGESVKAGWQHTLVLVQMILNALTPEHIGENVGGPVMIYKQTSSMVALGPYYLVQMGAMLSMSLAIINLVPLPAILDGGHLLLLGIEAIRRKRWTREQMQTMQLFGFALLAVVFVLVLVSDVTKIIGGQVPQ